MIFFSPFYRNEELRKQKSRFVLVYFLCHKHNKLQFQQVLW